MGYLLTVGKEPGCDVDLLTKAIQRHIPLAELYRNSDPELVYFLPHNASSQFQQVFEELDTNRDAYAITNYTTSSTSLDQVSEKH